MLAIEKFAVAPPLIAVDAIVVIGACAGLALIALLIIIWAPGKSIRNETSLDPETESRLLLGENPQVIANDLDQKEKSQNQPEPTD